MLCRTKPSPIRRRVRRWSMRIVAVILLSVLYFEVAVRVQLSEVIRAGVRALALSCVNTAVSDFLAENPEAGERLTKMIIGENGTVSALTTDSAYINYVKTRIAARAQEEIDACAGSRGVSAPLGSFTGLMFLSDLGPEVTLTVGSRSSVWCTFTSAFESAGINQTLHHISLSVQVDTAVNHPFRIRKGVTVTSDYEIAQTVIVGTVPSYGGVVTY